MNHLGGTSKDWSAERNMESGNTIHEFSEKNRSLLVIELESISWYSVIESAHDSFCPWPENLHEVSLNDNRLIYLTEEISSRIASSLYQSYCWLLLSRSPVKEISLSRRRLWTSGWSWELWGLLEMDSSYFALYDCHEPVESKDERLWLTSGMLGCQINKGGACDG